MQVKTNKKVADIKADSLDQARDTGMAMVLVVLLLVYFGHYNYLVPLAIVLLVLCMVWPKLFFPLSVLWFGISHKAGTFISNVLLTFLFFCMIMPVGFIRRLAGADPLKLKEWKKGAQSVLRKRDMMIKAEDLEHPY
jgi:hypothetical protein